MSEYMNFGHEDRGEPNKNPESMDEYARSRIYTCGRNREIYPAQQELLRGNGSHWFSILGTLHVLKASRVRSPSKIDIPFRKGNSDRSLKGQGLRYTRETC